MSWIEPLFRFKVCTGNLIYINTFLNICSPLFESPQICRSRNTDTHTWKPLISFPSFSSLLSFQIGRSSTFSSLFLLSIPSLPHCIDRIPCIHSLKWLMVHPPVSQFPRPRESWSVIIPLSQLLTTLLTIFVLQWPHHLHQLEQPLHPQKWTGQHRNHIQMESLQPTRRLPHKNPWQILWEGNWRDMLASLIYRINGIGNLFVKDSISMLWL